MTIKKKIRLSNIMMVLIPILFTTIVLIVCLNTSLGSYWHTFVDMYSDENGVQFAQSMIYNYQQELWENNWGHCPEMDECQAQIRHSDEMTHLENKLSGLGYRFMITKDGENIYSNLSKTDLETARSVAGDAIDYAKMLTASRYEVSVIKSTFWHGENVFCITAVHPQETDGAMVNYLKNCILRYLAGILVLFVVLTVCINGILSWWISGSILKPLGKLSLGTKEIREGNLDTPMQYEKKDEFGQVCRDFDEMRAYLQESVQQRLKDEKRRRDLITGISHDLRTPLTTIMGYLDGLLDGIADTPEKRLRYLQAIKTRTGNLVSLVDSLSEYSRLDAGFRYHMEETDFKDYVEKYLELVRPDMENQQVQTEYFSGKGNFLVCLDREEFKRVFNNLFANTVRYRRKENSRVMISLKRTLEGNNAELVFQDDGPGVPERSLEQRREGKRHRAGGGEGNHPRPRRDNPGGKPGRAGSNRHYPGYRLIGKESIAMERVLIIEDDELIAELEWDYLEANGYETDLAFDGITGEEKAKTEKYDAILLDVMLPGKTGFDVCRELRKSLRLPIIMVTAKKEDIDKIRGLGLGADDYLVKPFSPTELVARVKSHIYIHNLLSATEEEEQQETEITYRNLTILPKSRRVYLDKKEVILVNKEFELLLFLAENPNLVFSKDTLFDRVWGMDSLGDAATVTVHINRLRDKLGKNESKNQFIETVWGAGYRFRID